MNLIHKIAGKLIVEDETFETITKEKAFEKTKNCIGKNAIFEAIENDFALIKDKMKTLKKK